MNNKITNPLLKQLISEIANKANEGRMTNLSWASLKESKNILKKEADEKDPLDSILGGDTGGDKKKEVGGEQPSAEKADASTGGDAKAADTSGGEDKGLGKADAEAGAEEENPEKAQADAAKAKAELEKAKAEKAQAEEELEQHSYIKLKSSGGTKYLLNKVLGSAFRTNTVDALAAEMAQKLKITTPEDAAAFEKDMALYKAIPGMVELIKGIKDVAVEAPATPTEEEQPE